MSALSPAATSSALSSLQSSTPTISGIVSGLDTNKIIDSLLAVQQSQIQNLTNNQNKITARQAAYKGIETRLLTLQGDLTQLGKSQNSVFDTQTTTSSSESLVTAVASSSAVAGVYPLRVTGVAQANQIASQGFADPTAKVTQGTLQLNTGTGPAATITIDSSNDTVQGLANAINAAGAGVTASLVNDGSTGTPIRLLLTSNQTGLANAINITNNLAADSGPAVKPLFNTTVQAAANATITLGSGTGALTIQSQTNQIDNVVPGVTLNVHAADPNTTVNITVSSDTSKANQGIQNFVKDYNDLMSFIDDQTHYTSDTGDAGVLLGDYQATAIQSQLQATVGDRVANINPSMNHLSALGITIDDQGHLVLDQSKLDNVLQGNVTGVSLNDVRRLFALAGTSTSGGVQFVTGSDSTPASTTPIQVDVTQAAQQGSITSTNALADSTVIDGTNNTFSIKVDGLDSGAITLAQGNYTQQALAQEIQTQINSQSSLFGRQVAVGLQNGHLAITSATYGSSSNVTIGTGTALTALGMAGTESGQGRDVVGSFLVNGVAQQTTGSGQFLVGNHTNANTADLQVRVTLTPSQVVDGPEASLTVTRGLASQLNVALDSLLDPVSGRLKQIDDSFTTAKNGIQEEIDRQNELMQTKRDALVEKFTAMETAISQLQTIGNMLGVQIGGMQQQQQQQQQQQTQQQPA
jgi:flagellar hook-associated protein 2